MSAPGKPSPASVENGALGGRPVSSTNLRSQEIRRKLVEMFEKDAEELYRAQVEAAKGMFMGITDPETGEIIKIVKRAPSTEAYKILLNQSIGMPKQKFEGDINIIPIPIVDTSKEYKIESGEVDVVQLEKPQEAT